MTSPTRIWASTVTDFCERFPTILVGRNNLKLVSFSPTKSSELGRRWSCTQAREGRGRREEEKLGLTSSSGDRCGEESRQAREGHARLSGAIFGDERRSEQWGFQREGCPSYRVPEEESESSPTFDLHRETTRKGLPLGVLFLSNQCVHSPH